MGRALWPASVVFVKHQLGGSSLLLYLLVLLCHPCLVRAAHPNTHTHTHTTNECNASTFCIAFSPAFYRAPLPHRFDGQELPRERQALWVVAALLPGDRIHTVNLCTRRSSALTMHPGI